MWEYRLCVLSLYFNGYRSPFLYGKILLSVHILYFVFWTILSSLSVILSAFENPPMHKTWNESVFPMLSVWREAVYICYGDSSVLCVKITYQALLIVFRCNVFAVVPRHATCQGTGSQRRPCIYKHRYIYVVRSDIILEKCLIFKCPWESPGQIAFSPYLLLKCPSYLS